MPNLNEDGDLYQSSRNETVAVGTTSVVVFSSQKKRTEFTAYNSSTGGQTITLNFGSKAAVALAGIVLSAGQAFASSNSENFLCFQGVITAISSAAAGQLSVLER